jgi:hypothetical protein
MKYTPVDLNRMRAALWEIASQRARREYWDRSRRDLESRAAHEARKARAFTAVATYEGKRWWHL